MPIGDLDLLELADAVKGHLETEVAYLQDKVKVVEADDDAAPIDIQKALGTARYGVRIHFGNPAVVPTPWMNEALDFRFALVIQILFRKAGGMTSRMRDSEGRSVDVITKDVMSALEGQRLGILNRNGLHSAGAQYITQGSLQATRFVVTAMSRERRS